MKIGYSRISSNNQNFTMQINALKRFGCEKIFQDREDYFKDRPEFEQMNKQLQYGDVVVVWKLDRIGKSLIDLISLVDSLKDRGIDFVSLKDDIDTNTTQGRYFYKIMTSFSEFEREIASECTIAGLEAARKQGRKGGRPKGLSNDAINKAKEAKQLYEDNNLPVADIARTLGIGKTTLYRYLRYFGADIANKSINGIKITDKKVFKARIRNDLFKKLLELKAFWSYSNVSYEKISDDILIQKVMEVLDIDDIKSLFVLFNKNHIRRVWKYKMVIQNPYYRSLNILLAKLFFNISNPEQYIMRVQREYQKSILE